MGFTAIKKNTAVDMVVEQILKQIHDKKLPPGSSLPAQRELAVMLGVGRSSIREAVNVLVARGYLEPIQGKGTFIKDTLQTSERQFEKLSIAARKSSFFDLMEARTVLECKTAALVATRVSVKGLEKLQDRFKTLSEETEQGSYAVFLESDMAFHYALAEATDNKLICEMTKFVLQLLSEHHGRIKTDHLSRTYRKRSVNSLGRVLTAVSSQDPISAAQWMEKHLNVIIDELDEVF